MSPRRALVTAFVMSLVPASFLWIGIGRFSESICSHLSENIEVSSVKQKTLQSKCRQATEDRSLFPLYSIFFLSALFNWPVIRWLDDRQWYREWIREEDKKSV